MVDKVFAELYLTGSLVALAFFMCTICAECHAINTFWRYWINMIVHSAIWPISLPTVLFGGTLPFVLFRDENRNLSWDGLPFKPK
jgi:hypothetical protein